MMALLILDESGLRVDVLSEKPAASSTRLIAAGLTEAAQ